MELRYRMAVVAGAGGGLGREVAVALGRRGMSVLAADPDLAAAEETAAVVRQSRVVAWPFQVDLTRAGEVSLLAARARDLGGADCLVVSTGCAALVTRAFLAGRAQQRARDAPADVVRIATGAHRAGCAGRTCAAGLVATTEVPAFVVEVLARGEPGLVVELVEMAPGAPPA